MIARSIGAAPRQRGSSEGWRFRIRCSESSGSLINAPKAQTQTACGSISATQRRVGSSLTNCGCASLMPSSRAAWATGGAERWRPRPRGRSGRVITSSGRCGEAATRCRTAAANSEVPRETVRTPSGARLGIAQHAHRFLALLTRYALQDQHAVEVVDLMLDHACLQARCLDHDRLAVLVRGPDAHMDRALYVDVDRRQAEAALLHDLLLVADPFDLGVDQRSNPRLLLHAVHEHAIEHAHLGGRKSDPERVGHQFAHPRDLVAQRVIKSRHGARAGAQHRIAEFAHMGQSSRPPRRDFGIELWLLGLWLLGLWLLGLWLLGLWLLGRELRRLALGRCFRT